MQDVYFSKGEHGHFEAAVNIGSSVNSTFDEMSVFVDPDQRIMIVGSANNELENRGNDDLYLYRKIDESWVFQNALSDKINTLSNDYGAEISSDGKWLFITSDIIPPAKIYQFKWN